MKTNRLFYLAIGVMVVVMMGGRPTATSAQYDVTQCPSSMISYWRFEESTGLTAFDAIDSNDGTLFGPLWILGQVDWALGFGGSDYVEVPNSDALNPEHLTLELWTYPTSTGYYRGLAEKQLPGFAYPWAQYALNFSGNTSKPSFMVDISNIAYGVTADEPIPLNVWTYLAGTYDGETLKLYVNGELVKTEISPNGPIDSSPDPFYIGKPPSNAYYYGKLDEVAIYNQALSAEEIQQHYFTSLYGQTYCEPSQTNQPPIADADGPYTINEGDTTTLDASNSSDSDNNIVLYEWDLDNDGEYDDAIGTTTEVSIADDGIYIVGLRVTDDYSDFDTDTAEITIVNVVPIILSVNAPVDPMQVGISVETSAIFADPGVLDTHTAAWDWGDGTTSDGVVDGYNVNGSHAYDTPGVYTLTLTVEDDDGGKNIATFQYVVIYDPNGGFVTGGGWINSPAGAYTPDPSLTGKATFGFVSKYLKGANVPTGNTEFQFHVANMTFKSTSYDWLVIAGTKAQYKGTGTINGAGEYKFMLTAIDGTPDKFRIKIWDAETGEVIYDNQLGASDISSDATELGGGSIVIHKPK